MPLGGDPMGKSNLKILVIDDMLDNLTSMKAMLTDALPGCRVATASSGRKGIAMAMIEDPDVILLDIYMPGMNGFEVCMDLKDDERLKMIPVVFLTAIGTMSEVRQKAMEAGAEAFLVKPVEMTDLTMMILAMSKIKEAHELRQQVQEKLSGMIMDRTGKLRIESIRRGEAEEELTEVNYKLRKSHLALLNILEDLKVQNIARKESEEKFRGITEQMNDMIFITDMAGLLTFISPASRDIFGYAPEEMVGKHFMMFLDKSQVKKAQEKFRFAFKTGKTAADLILTMERKDGTLFQGELKSTLFIQDNQTIGTMGLIRDITDRLNAEINLKETAQRLRELTTHIQEVLEEERREIALNLHDDLGQKLTALNIDLAWLAGRIPVDLPELSEKINGMHVLLMETTTRVKQISSQLRPSILDDLGIGAAIIWQTNEFSSRTDVPCKVSIIPEEIMMPPETGTQVFRIVQEALTNIMRHAEASNVVISLIEKESKWRLRIKDNGKGFSEEDIGESKSFGLTGMEERTRLCGGTFTINGMPGKGTEVVVEIPIS